jgi:uncharacterized protein
LNAARPPFHLAFPVDDLEQARAFYATLLGCPEGRSAPSWVDFDLFGHQITAHLVPRRHAPAETGAVDGDAVPVRHFGIILPWPDWEALAARLQHAGVRFRIAPRIRFAHQTGEQATMFFDDPSGNTLEFKAFLRPEDVFAR